MYPETSVSASLSAKNFSHPLQQHNLEWEKQLQARGQPRTAISTPCLKGFQETKTKLKIICGLEVTANHSSASVKWKKKPNLSWAAWKQWFEGQPPTIEWSTCRASKKNHVKFKIICGLEVTAWQYLSESIYIFRTLWSRVPWPNPRSEPDLFNHAWRLQNRTWGAFRNRRNEFSGHAFCCPQRFHFNSQQGEFWFQQHAGLENAVSKQKRKKKKKPDVWFNFLFLFCRLNKYHGCLVC